MSIISTDRTPKGNTGMTALSTSLNNDDGSFVFPDIGFDFYYNGVNVRTTIYSSGNSWMGFGSATEHLDINRRDARCHYAYYIVEQENGKDVFRIRWEGYSVYSNTTAIDLSWEVILYNDNTIVLVVDQVPGSTGTNTFLSQGNGTLTFAYTTGKSYVFSPAGLSGTSYTVTEGSYQQIVKKYLMDDGANGIKHWDSTNNTWVKVADGPINESMFATYGDVSVNLSRTGLVLTNPTLLYYVQSLTEGDHTLHQICIPLYRTVVQNFDYNTGTGIKSVVLTSTVSSTSLLDILVSIDSGITWKAFIASTWTVVDITNLPAIETSAMTPTILNAITQAQWLTLVDANATLRFAYYLKQVNVTDTVSIDEIRVNYI
jgi:hypothetical protein